MSNSKTIMRGIILVVLLICTVTLVCSIIINPLGEHDIMLALAVTVGFIVLSKEKRKTNAPKL